MFFLFEIYKWLKLWYLKTPTSIAHDSALIVLYFLSITASGCNPSGSSEVSETGVCTPCKEGYEGSKCNLCMDGYYKQVDGSQTTCTGKNA